MHHAFRPAPAFPVSPPGPRLISSKRAAPARVKARAVARAARHVAQLDQRPFAPIGAEVRAQLLEERRLAAGAHDEVEMVRSLGAEERQLAQRAAAQPVVQVQRRNADESRSRSGFDQEEAQPVRRAEVPPPGDVPIPGLIGRVVRVAVKQLLSALLELGKIGLGRDQTDGYRRQVRGVWGAMRAGTSAVWKWR